MLLAKPMISSCGALPGLSSRADLSSCVELQMLMQLRLCGTVGVLVAVAARHTLGNPIDRSHLISPFGLAVLD